MPKNTSPPLATRIPEKSQRHGNVVTDDYAWLKDKNWQEVIADPNLLGPNIRSYLEAENAYAKQHFAATKGLQQKLIKEMRGRIKEDDASIPAKDGTYEYFTRFEDGGQHPIFCRFQLGSKVEQVLLHGDKEAKGLPYYKVRGFRHSPNHELFAYSVDLNGSERCQIKIHNIHEKNDLPDYIENTNGEVVWGNSSYELYYTILDENHRPHKVLRHQIGDDPSDDQIVYEESDPGFFIHLSKTQNSQFVVINAHDHTTSETHLIDASRKGTAPIIVNTRETDLEYEVEINGKQLFILTNAENAIDFKIATTSIGRRDRKYWMDLVPAREGCLIQEIIIYSNFLVRMEMFEGLPRIIVREIKKGREYSISFEEETYDLSLLPGFEFDSNILRFTYSSLTTPTQTYSFNMKTQNRVLLKKQKIPSGHDPNEYISKKLMVRSHDEKLVPVSVIYNKNTPLDGSAPVLLYGYGSYGISIPASFSANRFSLIDRGYIYAIAHIRGGTEKGYGWYLDGKLNNKKNTFLDFISVAEHLISENYTKAGNIAIHGASAGGLLVGACVNMRPDLWGAVVGEVPFVDVLSTICDSNLPLTPPEWPEWGNPLKDLKAYNYILSYSPIDNIIKQEYPPILVTAGLTDPRVTYWEPAKWVAKLRRSKTDNNPIYLLTNMEAGHGGSAGRFDRLDEVALIYTFVLESINVNE